MRMPRLSMPNVAQHVIVRSNSGEHLFKCAHDCSTYLQYLKLACEKYRSDIHAYVLMPNHVHLLISSTESGAVAKTYIFIKHVQASSRDMLLLCIQLKSLSVYISIHLLQCSFRTNLILSADDGVPLLRTDTNVLAAHEEVNSEARAQAACCSEHCDERVGGWIAEPCFTETIVLIRALEQKL